MYRPILYTYYISKLIIKTKSLAAVYVSIIERFLRKHLHVLSPRHAVHFQEGHTAQSIFIIDCVMFFIEKTYSIFSNKPSRSNSRKINILNRTLK